MRPSALAVGRKLKALRKSRVAKDAAAEGRASKTDIATGIGAASVAVTTIKETVGDVSDTAGTLGTFLPQWLVYVALAALVGVLAYKFWERRRKKLQGRSALKKLRDVANV